MIWYHYCYTFRLICYKLPGKEINTLSDLISQKSERLTPNNVKQIILDIEAAVNSLQMYSIIHRNINTDTVFISILAKVYITLSVKNCFFSANIVLVSWEITFISNLKIYEHTIVNIIFIDCFPVNDTIKNCSRINKILLQKIRYPNQMFM